MSYLARNYSSGDGSNRTFTVPFPYLSQSHVVVYIAGTPVDNIIPWNPYIGTITWLTSGTIQLGTAPSIGSNNVLVVRETPKSSMLATIQAGSIRPNDLNTNYVQLLYIAQEDLDKATADLAASEVTDGHNLDDAVAALSAAIVASSEEDAANLAAAIAGVNGTIDALDDRVTAVEHAIVGTLTTAFPTSVITTATHSLLSGEVNGTLLVDTRALDSNGCTIKMNPALLNPDGIHTGCVVVMRHPDDTTDTRIVLAYPDGTEFGWLTNAIPAGAPLDALKVRSTGTRLFATLGA